MKTSRHINHTGRHKIKRSEVQINLIENPGDTPPSFDASFKLDSGKLPEDAALYVEAYHKNTTQRFHFGTARSPIPPEDRSLDQLDLSGPILFRIKVVDNSEKVGRLVASAERLRPEEDEEEENRASLMTFKSMDLGDLTWKMSFLQDSKPVLCINSRIPEAKEKLMSNPVFQGLILPAALRETLLFIFLNIAEEDADEDSWHKPWIDFANFISPEEKPDSADPFELNDWIDGVVTEFSRLHELCDLLITRTEDSGL